MATASPPPLPKIDGDVDLFLDVFTHNSLRMPNAPMNPEYGNTDRLALLGASVLRLVVATHFFRKTPQLKAHEIHEQLEHHLTDPIVDSWMTKYNLKTKLRIAPSEMEKIHDVKEMRKVFETYVGALYIRNGLGSIEPWISRLIDPAAEYPAAPLPSTPVGNYTSSSAPSIVSSYAPSQASYTSSSQQSSYPPAPKAGPPPAAGPPPYASAGAQFHQAQQKAGGGGMYNMVTVALLNQKAMQMGYQVTYPAEHTGPPHNPLWTVRCCLNNREYGRGSGKSQKIAKDEAARNAWAAMGW